MPGVGGVGVGGTGYPAAPYQGVLEVSAYTRTNQVFNVSKKKSLASLQNSRFLQVSNFHKAKQLASLQQDEVVITGQIILFAGAGVPAGYLVCDGSLQLVATYPALQAVIGYTFGGAGPNFALPDLRGRVPVGPDPAGVHMPGELPVVGTAGGLDAVALTAAQSGLPAHTHTAGYWGALTGGSGQTFQPLTATGSGVGANGLPVSGTAGPTNAAQSHGNVQPFLCAQWLIKT